MVNIFREVIAMNTPGNVSFTNLRYKNITHNKVNIAH